MKHYFLCQVVVETDDELGAYDCSCDETFDVIRALSKDNAVGLCGYKEVTEEQFNITSRILTEEGGI